MFVVIPWQAQLKKEKEKSENSSKVSYHIAST